MSVIGLARPDTPWGSAGYVNLLYHKLLAVAQLFVYQYHVPIVEDDYNDGGLVVAVYYIHYDYSHGKCPNSN